MRTFLLLFISILFVGTISSQVSFEEDFESYNVGDGIAASSSSFVLWPAAAATDAFITDEQAAAGEKSLALPGGQDIDVLLNFGEQFTEGSFRLDFDVFIPTGRNTYFNFQGSDQVGVAGNWVLQCYLRANGIFEVDNSEQIVFSNSYPQNEWMTISLDINLTENLWRMFINGECLGSFRNTDENNQIYSMDLFPDDGNSNAFVDNMSFSHNPDANEVDISIDAAAFGGFDANTGIGIAKNIFYGIAGTDLSLELNVRNDGVETIESFSIELDGNNISTTQDVTMTILPGEFGTVELDDPFSFTDANEFAQFKISNVNGGAADDNTCNNTMPLSFIGFVPADNKKVLVEESTGRGCTFCPRGHVYMNYMAEKYPDHFVGVAVHNDDQGLDPMTNLEWDSGMLPITAQPNLWIERDTALIINPSAVEQDFVSSVQASTIVQLQHGAQMVTDREVNIQVTTSFDVTIRDNTRLMVGLTENGVQGITAGYAQVNAYSGGGLGPMGGYEDLANPVPASQMIYNDVARLMITPGLGMDKAYQDVEDDVITHSFNVTIPDEWNIDNMHIVSAFIGPDGRTFNAQKTTIAEAVSNGYSATIDPVLDQGINVFPNPTAGIANISLEFENPTEVSMEVSDALGKSISIENLGTISGKNTKSFDSSTLDAGIYYLSFRSGNHSTIKRLVVTK